MTDGSALLMNSIFGLMSQGVWNQIVAVTCSTVVRTSMALTKLKTANMCRLVRSSRSLCAVVEKTGLDQDPDLAKQMSRDDWPMLRQKLAAVMATKTRDEWDAIMLGTDICYAPILNFEEAVDHPTIRLVRLL